MRSNLPPCTRLFHSLLQYALWSLLLAELNHLNRQLSNFYRGVGSNGAHNIHEMTYYHEQGHLLHQNQGLVHREQFYNNWHGSKLRKMGKKGNTPPMLFKKPFCYNEKLRFC